MSNRLEDFIRDNRDAFDNDEPQPQLWKNLKSTLEDQPEDERIFHLNFLRWTAAAAVVIMLVGMFYYMERRNEDSRVASVMTAKQGATTEEVMNEIDPSYAKQVYHFTQLIELKQSELKQIEKEHPELYNQFVKDINKLDSSYNALKDELPRNPNRELLLEAMLQNLQLQSELLNQQLSIIKKLKQKNSYNETNSKSI